MPKIEHNAQEKCYKVEVEPNHWAQLDYEIQDQILLITHTFVPEALRGRGCAKTLMQTVLDDIEKRKLLVRPLCSYAVIFMQRHKEYHHLLA